MCLLLSPRDEEISVTSLAENDRRFVLLDTRRCKEVADAALFFEATQKKPRSEDLEEEVNRRQGAIMQKEKERSGLLETMERKQESRIGAPKESEEALFRDTGLGQRDFGDGDEAGKDLWESRWNGERSKPERRMLLEVAFLGRGGIWSLKLSKIGPSGESGVGVNGNGSLGDQRSMSSTGGSQNRRKTVVRKESTESQVYKSCQQRAWSWASPRCGERFGWVARNPQSQVHVRCHSGVKQNDDERKSIVQQILLKSTDFVRRISVPVEGQG